MKSFVGRTRELGDLAAALERVAAGQCELFVVAGEPGIGKTRLCDEASRLAEKSGFRVAWGRAWDDVAPPYLPWTQLLRSLDGDLPALPGEALDPMQARFAVFAGVVEHLRKVCSERPVLAVVDDVHTADMPSLLLLRYVLREGRALRLLVLVTQRTVEAQADPAQVELLHAIAREGTWIPMRRFDRSEVASLAKSFEMDLPVDAISSVFQATEGHPLLTDHVLRDLRSRGGAAAVSGAVSIPREARDKVRAWVSGLDAETRSLLEVAAVMGRETEAELVLAMTRVDASELARAVERGQRAGVIVDESRERIVFAHALLRDALYEGIDPLRRAALHKAALDTLERRQATTPEHGLDAIAHHALSAMPSVEPVRASRAVRAAAQWAMAQLAFEQAATGLERAHDALDGALSANPLERFELLLALGVARLRSGQAEAGRRTCLLAADGARSLGNAGLLARAALACGAEIALARVDPELVALLEEALSALSERQDPALYALVLARLAAALQPARDMAVPLDMARRAVVLARASCDEKDLRSVVYFASAALGDMAPASERITLDQELLRLSTKAGDPLQMLRAHARLVFDFMETGEVHSADANIEAYEALASALVRPRLRATGLLLRAMRALFAGDYEEVDRRHRELTELVRLEDHQDLLLPWGGQRYRRLLDAEEFEELARFEPAHQRSLASHSWGGLIAALFSVQSRARQRDLEGTRVELARIDSETTWKRILSPASGPTFKSELAEAVALVGDDARIEELYRALLPDASRFGHGGMVGMVVLHPVGRALGLLAAARGRKEDARRHFEDAIARAARAGAKVYEARMRRELAEVARSAPPGASPAFALRREGEFVTVEHRGKVARFKDSIGLRLLARLVDHRDQELHVLLLASGSSELGEVAEVEGDGGALLDERAIAAYRERLEELRERLSDAESRGDLGVVDKARAEIDALGGELARALGLGGRSRRAGSAVERARVNVQRHVRGGNPAHRSGASRARRVAGPHRQDGDLLFISTPRPAVNAASWPLQNDLSMDRERLADRCNDQRPFFDANAALRVVADDAQVAERVTVLSQAVGSDAQLDGIRCVLVR